MSERALPFDRESIRKGLYESGIIGLQGAFSRQWARQLGEDIDVLFREAIARPNGALNRGPERYYVEIQPERVRGFRELVTHPWVTAVCETILGPEYQIVEIGFDIPGPGSALQPWHRDFPSPVETLRDRKLTSLAFNLTTVDVSEDMGPFEIAPGTQWDVPNGWEDNMFPPQTEWARYESLAQKKMPKMGDISARSALTIHRGTPNRSNRPRPALVLGVDAPGAGNAARHDLQLTHAFAKTLDASVIRHLTYRLVDELEPIYQAHTIAGLTMGMSAPA